MPEEKDEILPIAEEEKEAVSEETTEIFSNVQEGKIEELIDSRIKKFFAVSDWDEFGGGKALLKGIGNLIATVATSFEDAGRVSETNVGGGDTIFGGGNPTTITTSATATSSSSILFPIAANIFVGSPSLYLLIDSSSVNPANGSGSSFFGLGTVTVNGSGHTYTTHHAGFKFLKSGGSVSLYATQGNGTTETASVALATSVVDADMFDLFLQFHSTSAIGYFVRRNGGAWSNEVLLTTNLPTSTTSSDIQCSSSNDATAFSFDWSPISAVYKR